MAQRGCKHPEHLALSLPPRVQRMNGITTVQSGEFVGAAGNPQLDAEQLILGEFWGVHRDKRTILIGSITREYREILGNR